MSGSVCSLGQQVNYRQAAGLDVFRGFHLRYEYMFNHSTLGFWDAGAGVGAFGTGVGPLPVWYVRSVLTNVSYNFHFSEKNRFIECGIGGWYASHYAEDDTNARNYSVGPQLGFRSIQAKGFQFRACSGVYYGNNNISVGAVLGIGWAFRKLD